MASPSYKLVKLRYRHVEASLYLYTGVPEVKQTREYLDWCIKSLVGVVDNSYEVVGLIELRRNFGSDELVDGQNDEVMKGALVPLELLAHDHSLIQSDKWYYPHLYKKIPCLPVSHSSALPVEDLPLPPVHAELATAPSNNNNQASNEQTVPVPTNAQTVTYHDGADPWQNYEYFHQYSKLDIHNEMIKDEARTKAYLEAVQAFAPQLKGKVVMDLGCGTGILSFFAARAGAKKVYAIEASSLADWTEIVVATNKMSDVIKVIKCQVEDLTFEMIDNNPVDVIISEWMGTFLIFESMLESLLFARDKFLKPDGFMMPSDANIYLAPINASEYFNDKIYFWNKVYDVDMSPLIPFAKKCSLERPIIDRCIRPETVLASPIILKSFDLETVPVNEPYDKTIVGFVFKVNKTSTLHGFAAWFDVTFNHKDQSIPSILLSTSPDHKDTHWHQDLFLFNDPIDVKEGDTIQGTIRYQRNPELLRHLIIEISITVPEQAKSQSRKFYLWGYEGQQ